jgi:Zn-dependent metalloprotease
MTNIGCHYVPPFVLKKLEKSDDPTVVKEAKAAAAPIKKARDKRADALVTLTEAQATAQLTSAAPTPSGIGRREIFDSENTTQQRKTLVRAEGDPATPDTDVTAAYDYLGVVRDFFGDVLGRASIDNTHLDLIANVHYRENYKNAFWDGDEMTFGDGDGAIFTSFAESLDVVAHELAHGVTQFTAGLVYKSQSGALNEHFSDVFGTAITQWHLGQTTEEADWLIGDEIMGPTLYGEALRSMREPGKAYDNTLLGTDRQPNHMDDLYKGTGDNGGVHINSGIPNRAFYLTAMELGDTVAATRVWYHALQRLWSKATFKDAAERIGLSARVLVLAGQVPKGTPQIVRGAFREVGL